MPDPIRIDPERLAALIDGRLGPAEAAEVRAQLAHADADTLAAYADAVVVAGEAEGQLGALGAAAPTAGVRPIASASSARRRWLAPALAAVAAGVIAVAVLRSSHDGQASPDLAAGLSMPPLGVPAWRSARGTDAPVTDRGRAVRTGVLLVQYELAARRADTAAASRAALIATLLEGVPGGSAAAVQWRALATSGPPATESARAEDVSAARALVDPDFVALGAWLESARSAAVANQAGWFDANAATPVARAKESAALTQAEREALAAIERAVSARPLDLGAVSAAVVAAETALAR